MAAVRSSVCVVPTGDLGCLSKLLPDPPGELLGGLSLQREMYPRRSFAQGCGRVT